MRAHGVLISMLSLLVACGGEQAKQDDAATSATDPDGFLAYLPEGANLVARLPSPERVAAGDVSVKALLRCFGHETASPAELLYRSKDLSGIDPARAAGIAQVPGGGWIQYLPAADKGLLNAALRNLVTRYALQEEDRWISLASGGTAPGRKQGEPLPSGDVALRLVHHRLLDEVTQPGDTLELGATLADGGIEFEGRLVPGEASPTGKAIANAGGEITGNIDLLPAWLAVRVESTLPSTIYATYLTRRIARHAGLPAGPLRDNIERFLREAATGIDTASGLALGIELRGGAASFVAVGMRSQGPPSPVLAKLRGARRTTFGGLVLDARDVPSKRIQGFFAWVPQATPQLEGLPDSLTGLLGDLVSDETGVKVAYTEAEGYSVVAIGPRADLLARKVRRHLVEGARGSLATHHLGVVRERGGAGCVLGIVVRGGGLEGLAETDRSALRALLGAGETATAPKFIAIAGWPSEDGSLRLNGRILYR